MNYKNFALALLLILFTQFVCAFPKSDLVPGGLVAIPFESDGFPKVYYRGNRVMVTSLSSKKWAAVVGIPLFVSPGEEHLLVERAGAQTLFKFMVHSKVYPTQHVTLSNQKQVEPDVKTLKRIKEESKEIATAFKHWRGEKNPIRVSFMLPVNGKISGDFGLRRVFNGQARGPHSGIDIAAPFNTPIRAPAKAKVLKVGNYFFNGKTLFLDHGQGLVTMYCHLNKILVAPHQTIKQGQPIARIGQTGRATGPHLHWSVSLNDARVDPVLFLGN